MYAPPDVFDFCADGTLLVVSAGRAYPCRRPLLREYGSLRASISNLIGGEDEIVAWVTDAIMLLSGEPPNPVPSWFVDPTLPSRMIEHWRTVPLGPWEPIPEGPAPVFSKRSPLSGVFAELAPIYEALAIRNVSPREADECEIWQIASILGLHDPDRETRQPSGRGGASGRGPGAARGNAPSQTEINRQRVEAAKAGAEPPRWQREHAAGGESELIAGLLGG